MTVKEAAVMWDVSEWRVRNWCKKGYLKDAAKKGNRWVIPEGTQRPYLSRKRRFARPYEKTDYILEAVGSGLYLDFRLLALTREEFSERAEMLVREGLLERAGTRWKLTLAGEDRLRRQDAELRKEVRDTISAAASLANALIAAKGLAA